MIYTNKSSLSRSGRKKDKTHCSVISSIRDEFHFGFLSSVISVARTPGITIFLGILLDTTYFSYIFDNEDDILSPFICCVCVVYLNACILVFNFFF